MKILIEYDSIWQNSFLSGVDDEPISRDNHRKFVATAKSNGGVFKPIEKSTVLGVLCRLIGDQRKLHQARSSPDYHFKDIEDHISYKVLKESIVDETAFITNKSESRPPQGTFVGVIKNDIDLFCSEEASFLWSVLYLDCEELLYFIINEDVDLKQGGCKPRDLLDRISQIKQMDAILTIEQELSINKSKITKTKDKINEQQKKLLFLSEKEKRKKVSLRKSIEKLNFNLKKLDDKCKVIENSTERNNFDKNLLKATRILNTEFPKKEPKGKVYMENGRIFPLSLYSASLYLQVNRMRGKSMNVEKLLNNNGKIQGFSLKGYNGKRDFLNPFTNGNGKKTNGTPFQLTKASGKLEIDIPLEREKAVELKTMIENAGVSSFYLGKKGLAYVSNIRI